MAIKQQQAGLAFRRERQMTDVRPEPESSARLADAFAYLEELMAVIRAEPRRAEADGSSASIAEKLFRLLTSREFCYLSRRRVAPYRDTVAESLRRDIKAGRPLRFYYDIGGGYHACMDPWGECALSFETGLGELCVLAQIKSFHDQVVEHYAPGVEFHLVIDNLCALLVNDVPVQSTAGYCRRLRTLIAETGMESLVSVLVESEHFASSEYRLPSVEPILRDAPQSLTRNDIENVARFLGRPCGVSEARMRIAKYRTAMMVSEEKLNTVIDGVRMTQRATPTTLCFRPFMGADVRIQAGEVALATLQPVGVRPVLLTSRNLASFRCQSHAFPEILPEPIEKVTIAERISQDAVAG